MEMLEMSHKVLKGLNEAEEKAGEVWQTCWNVVHINLGAGKGGGVENGGRFLP